MVIPPSDGVIDVWRRAGVGSLASDCPEVLPEPQRRMENSGQAGGDQRRMCKLRGLGKGPTEGLGRSEVPAALAATAEERGGVIAAKGAGRQPSTCHPQHKSKACKRARQHFGTFSKGRPIFANIFTALGPRSGCDSIRTGPWLSLKRQDRLTAPLTPHHCMDAPHRVRRQTARGFSYLWNKRQPLGAAQSSHINSHGLAYASVSHSSTGLLLVCV